MTTTPMRNYYTYSDYPHITRDDPGVSTIEFAQSGWLPYRERVAGRLLWVMSRGWLPSKADTCKGLGNSGIVLQPGCDPSQEFGENGLQIDMLSWVGAKILVGNYCIIYFACQYPNLYCWASFLGSFGQVSIFPSVHSINTHPQQFFGISLVEMGKLS